MRVFITSTSPFDTRRIFVETPAEFSKQSREGHESVSALLKTLSCWGGHDSERRLGDSGDLFKGYELPAALASELFTHYFMTKNGWLFKQIEDTQ